MLIRCRITATNCTGVILCCTTLWWRCPYPSSSSWSTGLRSSIKTPGGCQLEQGDKTFSLNLKLKLLRLSIGVPSAWFQSQAPDVPSCEFARIPPWIGTRRRIYKWLCTAQAMFFPVGCPWNPTKFFGHCTFLGRASAWEQTLITGLNIKGKIHAERWYYFM